MAWPNRALAAAAMLTAVACSGPATGDHHTAVRPRPPVGAFVEPWRTIATVPVSLPGCGSGSDVRWHGSWLRYRNTDGRRLAVDTGV